MNHLSTTTLHRLDTLTHWLHKHLRIPVIRPICDAYDARLLDGSPWVRQGDNWTTSSGDTVQHTKRWRTHT